MLKKLVKALLAFMILFQVLTTPFSAIANQDDGLDDYDYDFYLNEETDEVNEYGDLLQDVADEGMDKAYLADELERLMDSLDEPVGMQGFFDDDTLSDDQDAMVEIIVQFLTPPQVVLELAEEVNQGRPIGTRQAREGRRRRGNRNRFR